MTTTCLVFFTAVLASVSTLSIPLRQNVETLCIGQDNFLRIASVENCNNYFQCYAGRAYLMQCPEDTWFNEEDQICDWGEVPERCREAEPEPEPEPEPEEQPDPEEESEPEEGEEPEDGQEPEEDTNPEPEPEEQPEPEDPETETETEPELEETEDFILNVIANSLEGNGIVVEISQSDENSTDDPENGDVDAVVKFIESNRFKQLTKTSAKQQETEDETSEEDVDGEYEPIVPLKHQGEINDIDQDNPKVTSDEKLNIVEAKNNKRTLRQRETQNIDENFDYSEDDEVAPIDSEEDNSVELDQDVIDGAVEVSGGGGYGRSRQDETESPGEVSEGSDENVTESDVERSIEDDDQTNDDNGDGTNQEEVDDGDDDENENSEATEVKKKVKLMKKTL